MIYYWFASNETRAVTVTVSVMTLSENYANINVSYSAHSLLTCTVPVTFLYVTTCIIGTGVLSGTGVVWTTVVVEFNVTCNHGLQRYYHGHVTVRVYLSDDNLMILMTEEK
jgi:hypothetical protein